MARNPKSPKTVETLTHDEATRKSIPSAEYQSVMQKGRENPVRMAYDRRNRDPQLVWRGKDEQDWSDLVVHAPPLYIQEKVHPKVPIDDLLRETRERAHEARSLHPTSSPTSTACQQASTRPSSTSTTRTGPTG